MTTPRRNIMLGTAGHVDHGKTALVKLLIGCDTDRLAEEKARGLTIELGFAPCLMSDQRICGVVDVPGHVDFIRNMVAGAQGIDVVILVVAADDGVMPQTREHLDILTLMGVRHGLVALTKIDLVTPEMRELADDDVRQAIRGTFLEGAAVCPLSNITGEGFDGFFEALNAAADRCEGRELTGLFRLWVERAFPIHGFGPVASGIPSHGEVRVGDRLRVLPGEQTVRVRRLEVYGEDAQVGRAGECVALNLADVDSEHLGRGMVLSADQACRPVSMFEADLRLLTSLPQPLKDYAQVHVHVGTADTMAHVAFLEDAPPSPGSSGLAQMRLERPLPVTPGERFVIRGTMAGLAGGHLTTLGGGRVLDTSDVRLRRRRPWTLASLASRRDAIDSPRDWCAVCLKELADAATPADVASRAHFTIEQTTQLLGELLRGGVAIESGATATLLSPCEHPVASPGVTATTARFVHHDVVAAAGDRLLAILEQFHAANPMRLGLEQTELAARLAAPGAGGTAGASQAVFELALADLLARNRVERRGTVLGLVGRGPAMSQKDRQFGEQIEQALQTGGLTPPDATELAASLNVPLAAVQGALRVLIDQGRAVRLDAKLVLHADAVAAGQQVVLDLFRKAPAFTTMDFRDALNVSRKFAVPLLDYFDATRWTVRSGNRRTPGAAAKRELRPG